jgi:hypothetical protein
MAPEGWTESNTYYPAVNRSLWENTLSADTVKQVWQDYNVSPSVLATTKDTFTHNTFVADKTREQTSDEFLGETPKPNWTGNQHDAQERNEGVHYGLDINHAWDDNIRPHYQEITSNMDGDFLRIQSRIDQAEEANPEHSSEHRLTNSLMNEFIRGIHHGSIDTTTTDKNTVHKDSSFGESQYMSNNWPDNSNSELSDSSGRRETEKSHGQSVPVDLVTGQKAMSEYLRLFSSNLHGQINHPRGKEKKKKCDQDNDSSVPAGDTEYDADKEPLAAKAHIISSYSVLTNQRV